MERSGKEFHEEVRSLFIGEYRHSLDVKGRIIVPAKFREELGDNFIITRGLEECLFVYTNDEWKKITNKINIINI